MKLPCSVVRDLLPLHAEGLTEPETATLVEEHLTDCTPCAERLAAMRESDPQPIETTQPLKNLKKQLRLRRWCTALLAALMVFIVLFTYIYHTSSMQLLPWEDGLVQAKGVENTLPEQRYGRSYFRIFGDAAPPDEYSGEALVLLVDSRITGWASEYIVEDGITTVILQGSARGDLRKARSGAEPNEMVLYPVPDRVIYGYETPQQVIYGEETDFGVQVLPRLVLAYYRLFAVVLALVLGVLWLCLRRKPCAALMRQLFLAPASWLVAQLLLKGLDATSFHLVWDLGWILLLALAVYSLFTLAWMVWKQHRSTAA